MSYIRRFVETCRLFFRVNKLGSGGCSQQSALTRTQFSQPQYEGRRFLRTVATYIALHVEEAEGSYFNRTYPRCTGPKFSGQMCSQGLATGSCLEPAESSLHLLHSLFHLDCFCPNMLQTKVVNLSDVCLLRRAGRRPFVLIGQDL